MTNWQHDLMEIATKAMIKIEDEYIRDIDGSKMNDEHTERMISAIRECEWHLKPLLELTEEIGGFGSSYPKKCLESMKLFRKILEMELSRNKPTT